MGILDGIKVLDLTQVYSGPFCTLLLRDLGAEIIKVERPQSGDLIRHDNPHTEAMEGGPFIILNRGKKSLTLDLKTAKGREICRDLAKKVDVLVENFSPGTMEKLGLGGQELRKLNPHLIYASISAYGQTGPRRDYPGFDPVAQAMGGMTSVTGFPDQPVSCGVSIGDFSSGLFMALAVVSALFHRLRTGQGASDRYLDARLHLAPDLDRIFSALFPERSGSPSNRQRPRRHDTQQPLSHPGRPRDHRRRYVGSGEKTLLSHGQGGPFRNPSGRQPERALHHREEIDSLISGWTKTRTSQDVLDVLQKGDVPCAKLPF